MEFTFLLENRFVWRQRFPREIWQMIIWSGNLTLQFSWLEDFARETFVGGEHITSSSTKTAETINFKFCTHISNKLLHKTVPAFILIMSHSFFYCNNSTSFEIVFCMKTVKSWLFKKHLKRRKSRAQFCLSLGWIHISKKNYWKLQFCWCRSS